MKTECFSKQFKTFIAKIEFSKDYYNNIITVTFGIYKKKKEFKEFEIQTYKNLGISHLIWAKNTISDYINNIKNKNLYMDTLIIIYAADQRRFDIYCKYFIKRGWKTKNISKSYKQNYLYYIIKGKEK